MLRSRLRLPALSSRLSTLGFVIVVVCVLTALLYLLLGSRITPYDANAPNLMQSNVFPTMSHPFGTDFEGRDLLSRVIASFPIDVGLPVAVVLMSSALGMFLGVVAGYFGGMLEELIMRLTDLFLAFPTIVMVLAVAATLGPSLLNATMAIFFVWWPPYVRLVRGAVLEVSTQDFMAISKALNSSFPYIMRKNILPNVMPSILTYATLDVGTALLSLSTLGFLGVGIPPGTAELGVMAGTISSNLYTHPWEALIPAGIAMVIVLGFSLVGEGLREGSDIKVRPYIRTRYFGKLLEEDREKARQSKAASGQKE